MGCGCNKKKNKKEVPLKSRPLKLTSPPIAKVKYIFCPYCNVVLAKRLIDTQLVGYKCEKCGGKTASFIRPPSKNKLELMKQRMGLKE